MKFGKEPLQVIVDEGWDLFKKHYEEIAHFKEIPLNPDVASYLALEAAGRLQVFSARGEGNELVGYALFIVNKNLHYSSSLQASQDIIYIRPENRGCGREFITYCDNQLKELGVEVSYHHVKVAHNFGPMLEKLGYKAVDIIYGKKL